MESGFSWVHLDGRFAKQMQAAGCTRQERIAVAVSGGPDSMALCLLAARWKRELAADNSDGLLGFVVDHGLRSGSADEAVCVQQWVSNLGFSCDVLKCVWEDGIPAMGHIQECARTARYALLAQACERTGVEILLTAHHADDQAELFILRLSRCSGIAGLAGMASALRLYPALSPSAKSLLLIRPLLKFGKDEFYTICQESGQSWVEDPSNANLSFARNRIRKALKEESFMAVRTEIQQLIFFCRKIRSSLDRDCGHFLSEVAEVSQETGHVTLKVDRLLLGGVSNAVQHRTVSAVMQFVAQKVKPPRGRAVASVIQHLRAKKGVFTVGGCNVFPAPRSKGLAAIISFSPDSPPPAAPVAVRLDQSPPHGPSFGFPTPSTPVLSHAHGTGDEVPDDPVAANSIAKAVSALTLNVKTPRAAVDELKGLGLISEAGASLLTELSSRVGLDMGKQRPVDELGEASSCSRRECVRIPLSSGGSEYFVERFVVSVSPMELELCKESTAPSAFESDSRPPPGGSCCLLQRKMCIRHFEEKDWAHLSRLAKMSCALSGRGDLEKAGRMCGDSQGQRLSSLKWKGPSKDYAQGVNGHLTAPSAASSRQDPLLAASLPGGVNLPSDALLKEGRRALSEERDPCRKQWCELERMSMAKEALAQLRKVPKLVRRGLPAVITSQGLLLGVPSVGYSHCPLASMTAVFCPRTPLGGAQASWL